MNILITGATGFIGHAILLALARQGHILTACCRHPEALLIGPENIRPLRLDFTATTQTEQWLPHLQGIDAIINCVGIIAETQQQTFAQLHSQAPIALFTAGAQAGVKKIIQISALGADDPHSAYHLSKHAADEALRGLEVDWFVLQPSVVYGDRAQSSALFHALAALPVQVLPDGGGQLLQPVHVDDVVAAVCQCLTPATSARKTVALVGPAPIAYKDLLAKLRHRLGKPKAWTLALPEAYVLKAASLGKVLGEPILSKDNIAMLSRGNTAAADGITTLLGRPPLSMARQLFEKPASQAERWHAHSYFLKPVLRFAIALVWLWSGFTSLFFYPHEASYQLLAAMGVTGMGAPLLLYGLAFMDIAFGVATLALHGSKRLIIWQIAVVLAYTVVVGFALPEFWLHPFGPLLKNLPFLLTLWIYAQWTGEKP